MKCKCTAFIIFIIIVTTSITFLGYKYFMDELNNYNSEVQSLENRLLKVSKFIAKSETKLKNNMPAVTIDSGSFIIHKSEIPKLVNPAGCEANRGVIEVPVDLNALFLEPPKVVAGIVGLDFRKGSDHRLKVSVTNITKDSFMLSFFTWCDTKISYAEINWLAYIN